MKIPGFKIERLIADGGMSSVYLAVQESLDRRVALKVLRKFDSPKHAERFLYEGRIIASLNHRNIITIHDIGAVGAVGDQHYIAMEYLEGGSLGDRIDQGIELPDILGMMETIAGCLDFVHRREIIHRDVKPSNILFHADGTPKLTDFGIAKQLDDDQDLTMDGSAIGSPYYLSPEQAEGRPLDGRSDIYGLGIIFYQMLTGHRPYAENSHVETILAHLTHPLPVLPEAYSAYQDLLERMIAKAPKDRVASARELVDLLRAVRPVEFEPPGGASTLATAGSGRNWLRWFAAAGAGVWRSSSIELKIALAMVLLSLAVGTILLRRDLGVYQEAAFETQQVPTASAHAQKIGELPLPELSVAVLAAEPKSDQTSPEVLPGGATVFETRESSDLPDPDWSQFGAGEPKSTPAIQKPAVQASAIEPAPQPLDESDQTVDHWLRAADQALREYRLTTPPGENAYAYYQKIVALDPAHEEGNAGILRIAERYATLARKELNGENFRLARRYVQRGLGVRSNHAELLELNAEIDQSERAHAESLEAQSKTALRLTGASEPPSEMSQAPKGTGNIVKDFKSVWRSIF